MGSHRIKVNTKHFYSTFPDLALAKNISSQKKKINKHIFFFLIIMALIVMLQKKSKKQLAPLYARYRDEKLVDSTLIISCDKNAECHSELKLHLPPPAAENEPIWCIFSEEKKKTSMQQWFDSSSSAHCTVVASVHQSVRRQFLSKSLWLNRDFAINFMSLGFLSSLSSFFFTSLHSLLSSLPSCSRALIATGFQFHQFIFLSV